MVLVITGAVRCRDADDVDGSCQRIGKHGDKRTEALNTRKVTPDRAYETDRLSIVRAEDEHAAGTYAGGKVHGAVAKDAKTLKSK